MRIYKNLLVFSLATGLLYGCNKDEVKDVPANAPTEQNTNQQAGENVTDQVPFNFLEFALDVDYSPTESYEIEYENKKTGLAKI